MPASKQSWNEADLGRAIAAARDAGLKTYKIEIAPDGTITIIVPETGGSCG